MDLIIIIFKTIFFYLFVMFVYRLMGKREVGQLGIIDLIVSILIAELVAISIEDTSLPIMYTILPILVLVALEVGFALINLKSKKVRELIDGKPSLIICEGVINFREMIKQRYNLEDLLLSMRQKQIKSIEEIEYAFLEPNGRLSIFEYTKLNKKSSYPMALILDGKIDEEVLKRVRKTKNWLNQKIKDNNLKLENIFYGFYKDNELFIINKN